MVVSFFCVTAKDISKSPTQYGVLAICNQVAQIANIERQSEESKHCDHRVTYIAT